ncbi:calcium-binding protein [Azospirillum thermophilum]|nr:PD40 domain-containing protein [Azospirillum thermophilum]
MLLTSAGSEVYLVDMLSGARTMVSTDVNGRPADESAYGISMSADASKVLISTQATNLVPGIEKPGGGLLLLKDTVTGEVSLAARHSMWGQLSADGTMLLFESAENGLVPGDQDNRQDLFLKDLKTGIVTRVSGAADGSAPNGAAGRGALSADGRRVAFESSASNIVPNDTNGRTDIFVRDLVSGETVRVTSGPAGASGPGGDPSVYICDFSDDGRTLVLTSNAGGLVQGDRNRGFDVFVASLSGRDGQRITGTMDDDRLTGGSGDDVIHGLAGSDTILAGGDNDTIVAGAGDDRVDGAGGSDDMTGGDGQDTLAGGSGADTVFAGNGGDLVDGADGHDLLGGGPDSDSVTGGAGNDTLYAGDDGVADTLVGGSGDDRFWVNGPEDRIVERPGGGIDTVIARFSWTLDDSLENLRLQEKGASANGAAIGNRHANLLIGNGGNNRIDGLDGDDTIWATRGDDRADGGPGDDVVGGGGGSDSVIGGSGNDTLYGGDDAAADLLAGGPGDDVYWINGTADISAPADVIEEKPGEGTDAVHVKGSYRMADWIEILTMQAEPRGSASIAWGNALSNHITGNGAANGLAGLAGDDTLVGMAGDDSLSGGPGDDLCIGGAGNDSLGPAGAPEGDGSPAQGRDTLIGGLGDDRLDAGGTPDSRGLVAFDDAPDLIVVGREAGDGFGKDTIAGFDAAGDRILFTGYSPSDLAAPVTVTDVAPYAPIEGAMSWRARFSFSDGSTLEVGGIARGLPSFTQGSDYLFAGSPVPGP